MEKREQDKQIEMPSTTLGYNISNRDSSSSKLSSPIIGEIRSDHQHAQTHTLIFSDPPQTSHDHHLYPPLPLPLPLPPEQLQQSHMPKRDPDPNLSSIATTSTTPIARTATPSPLVHQATGTSIISTPLIRYRECLKNHAASIGGHVVDGCGEFMPSAEEGTPESLKCAACDCHRNFHRKLEAEGSQQQQQQQHHHVFNNHTYYPNKRNGHLPTNPSSVHQHHRFSSHGAIAAPPSGGLIPPMTVAFGGGATESSSEDLIMFQSNNALGQLPVQPVPLSSSSKSKKRFRTKFSQQQKDRMVELAEKLGWKIQKQDEQQVQQLCSQVGVKRQVFKVWMHNSKQAMKKKKKKKQQQM